MIQTLCSLENWLNTQMLKARPPSWSHSALDWDHSEGKGLTPGEG
jgi:hypothetical protein